MNVNEAEVLVFNGAGKPFELKRVPIPALGRGETLVELSLSTICGSDLHTVDGRRNEPTPSVLGHEGVGRVIAIGEGVEPAWVGVRVTWSSAVGCGRCRPCCDWDLPQKCVQVFKYGHARFKPKDELNGCYASHLVLKAGTKMVRLPDRVTDAMAAPANCALATMMASTETLREPHDCALIQGAGLLGIYGCAILRRAGWKRVLVSEPRPERRRLIASFGGEAIDPADAGQIPSGSVDAVLEVSGNPAVVPEAIRLLRVGGHYGLVGMVHPDSALGLTGETIIRKCLTLRGTHNYAPRHLEAAVGFLEASAEAMPWDTLVSPPLPLQDLSAAFELSATGQWPRVAVRP